MIEIGVRSKVRHASEEELALDDEADLVDKEEATPKAKRGRLERGNRSQARHGSEERQPLEDTYADQQQEFSERIDSGRVGTSQELLDASVAVVPARMMHSDSKQMDTGNTDEFELPDSWAKPTRTEWKFSKRTKSIQHMPSQEIASDWDDEYMRGEPQAPPTRQKPRGLVALGPQDEGVESTMRL